MCACTFFLFRHAGQKGSTAEEAGLKAGDVIVEVDGRDVLNASHEKVIQLLKSPNEHITLSVVPADHQMLVDVVRIMEKEYMDSLDSANALTTPSSARTTSNTTVRKAKSGHIGHLPSSSLQVATATTAATPATPHAAAAAAAAVTPTPTPPPQSPPSSPPTSGWLVVKEGLLIKSKKASGFFKSVKTRRFVLKVQPLSLTPELEYYAPTGTSVLGSLDCTGALIKPGFGAGFTIHAAVEDRQWTLAAEGSDVRTSTR